jgi:hypothetical protein
VPRMRLESARFAGVLAALLTISAALLTPSAVSPPRLPWHQPKVESHFTPVTYVTTMVVKEAKRKVYPYSIVPGGAQSLLEAKHAMTDPAVKANYATVNFAQLKQVKLTENISGYVSYRWGEKIYWTKKRLTLRAGETVFTDGTNIVRGRCLNCYSALPMLPTRPSEPTEVVFNAPTEMPVTVYSFPKLPVLAPELPIPPGELTPAVPTILPTVVATVVKTGGGFWFPIIPFIPPIHHRPSSPTSPGSPGTPGGPGTPPIPPVAVVPEPNLVWLLFAGFLALALGHGLRRRKVS